MQHLEVSCALRRSFKSLGFKGLRVQIAMLTICAVWFNINELLILLI